MGSWPDKWLIGCLQNSWLILVEDCFKSASNCRIHKASFAVLAHGVYSAFAATHVCFLLLPLITAPLIWNIYPDVDCSHLSLQPSQHLSIQHIHSIHLVKETHGQRAFQVAHIPFKNNSMLSPRVDKKRGHIVNSLRNIRPCIIDRYSRHLILPIETGIDQHPCRSSVLSPW